MLRLVILILIISRVLSQQSMQYLVHESRKSRSNTKPEESGYAYSQVNGTPGRLTSYATGSDEPIKKEDAIFHFDIPEAPQITAHSMDFAIAESKAKYDSTYYPAKIKSDALYERMKSIMHYTPSVNEINSYISSFHNDDNDIRTGSKNLYENWPYKPLYEYNHNNIDSGDEKAKEKRFVSEDKSIIPVHEAVEEDHTTLRPFITTSRYSRDVTSHPSYGYQPYSSYAIDDSFSNEIDDDHLVFNGLDWDLPAKASVNYPYQNEYHPYKSHGRYPYHQHKDKDYLRSSGLSATEKSYDKNHEYDKHEQGNRNNENHKHEFGANGNNQKAYKDIVDSFINKFGNEDHKRNSKFSIKKNKDNGENRKGFRKVYHKDEYQEENEFYDNNNNSLLAEEEGDSNMRNGGSEAFLRSQALAAIGNEANTYNKLDNKLSNSFNKNHSGYDRNKGIDRNAKNYRDIAKEEALSNNAIYGYLP